ncbi:MAG: hypothetical protein GY901_06100, partial [Actinomycetia bacterium]|nr:hypothetical protein [Actinomycetes bacterium]
MFNGSSAWQLYSGDGITARATLPWDRWVHVRLEFSGTQARVFLDDAEQPALVMNDLKRGRSKGWIGVAGP